MGKGFASAGHFLGSPLGLILSLVEKYLFWWRNPFFDASLVCGSFDPAYLCSLGVRARS
jgi:hypothetical protein